MVALQNLFHKTRFTVWLVTAYVKKHSLFIILGLVIGIAAGLNYKYLLPVIYPYKNSERIGVIGNYTQNSLPLEIQNLISFGLTHANDDGTIHPQAASTILIKDNGKTYIFKLQKNLYWHDGSLFTAKDINYYFKDVKVKVMEQNTVAFQLKEPYSPFPSLVSQPLFKKGLIGLGDLKVESIETSGRFISKISLSNSKKRLIFKFYPTENDAIVGFKLGEIKTLWGINQIDDFKNWKNLKIIPETKYNRYIALFFYTKSGIFSEKGVRQAFYYALPDNIFKEKRAYVPININSWAYNPNTKEYNYNLDSAVRLLAKTLGDDYLKKNYKIKLTVIKAYQKYALKIAQSWKKIGFDVKIETVSLPPERFDILLGAQEIPLDPDQYLLWHSTSKLNITGYNSKRVDKLLEAGRNLETDLEKRKEIYLDFQKYLIEDLPAIFLYYPTTYTVTKQS